MWVSWQSLLPEPPKESFHDDEGNLVGAIINWSLLSNDRSAELIANPGEFIQSDQNRKDDREAILVRRITR